MGFIAAAYDPITHTRPLLREHGCGEPPRRRQAWWTRVGCENSPRRAGPD